MPNVTFWVPADLSREMRVHPEVKWADVVCSAIRIRLRGLEPYERGLSRSKLTALDAVALGREIRRSAASRSK